jgi:hypothetical protein
MNNVVQFEDRVSRSRSKHEGESSADICDRLSRTRVSSQRQLPTDHDYAVPTREYQLDQSSPLPASAAAHPVLEIQKQNHPTHSKMLTGSHHINVRFVGIPDISTRNSGMPVIRQLNLLNRVLAAYRRGPKRLWPADI